MSWRPWCGTTARAPPWPNSRSARASSCRRPIPDIPQLIPARYGAARAMRPISPRRAPSWATTRPSARWSASRPRATPGAGSFPRSTTPPGARPRAATRAARAACRTRPAAGCWCPGPSPWRSAHLSRSPRCAAPRASPPCRRASCASPSASPPRRAPRYCWIACISLPPIPSWTSRAGAAPRLRCATPRRSRMRRADPRAIATRSRAASCPATPTSTWQTAPTAPTDRCTGARTAICNSRSKPRPRNWSSTTCTASTPAIRSRCAPSSTAPIRCTSGSSKPAGARPGCARTKPTWTALIGSNSSMPATRASRPWFRCT